MLIENPPIIKRSDVETLFTNVASTPLGNGIAFDFLINRWNDILAEYCLNSYMFFRYLYYWCYIIGLEIRILPVFTIHWAVASTSKVIWKRYILWWNVQKLKKRLVIFSIIFKKCISHLFIYYFQLFWIIRICIIIIFDDSNSTWSYVMIISTFLAPPLLLNPL